MIKIIFAPSGRPTRRRSAPPNPVGVRHVGMKGTARRLISGLVALGLWAAVPALPAFAEMPSVQSRSPARVADLEGAWEGSMEMGIQTVTIRAWFDGAGSGRFQIVGVTTDRNPLTNVTVEAGRVRFSLPSSPPQTFTGRLENDTIRGTVSMAGNMSPFRLQRVSG